MRWAKIIRSLLVGNLVFSLILLIYRHSTATVYVREICTLKTYTIEYNDGYNSYSTSGSYWDCVTYYMYLYDGEGGGAGDASGNVDGDIDNPGGGGVIVNPNDYDKNNDGFIDCYKNTIMRVPGLFISSDCNDQRSYGLHNAWDITGPGVDGKTIYSVSDGTVIAVSKQTNPNTGEISGWGYYVMIKDKEGNIWIYAHLKGSDDDPSGLGLTIGSKVTAGVTPVGVCDSSGNSTGAHLHLELRLNGQKTCPDTKIGRC